MLNNLRELQRFDVENVLYNTNEFSLVATWGAQEFPVNQETDYEVDDTQHKHFLAQSRDVSALEEGDVVTIKNEEYELLSISDVENSYGLEKRLIMGLV